MAWNNAKDNHEVKNHCEKNKNNNFDKSIWKKLNHRFQHLPVALTGLALGLCGIASALDTIFKKFYHPNCWWISIGFIAVASFLLLLATIRNFSHKKVVLFEAKEPLLSSFLPTYAMTLMCIAGFIAGWEKGNYFGKVPPCQVIGAILMCLSVVIQIVCIVAFVKNVLLKHNWDKDSMYGSWLVPTVGPATAATFTGRFNENILPVWFFQIIWFFAFANYVVLFVVVTYSLLFKKKADIHKFPSIAVYFAPANLVLAGFLQTFAIPSVEPYYIHTPEVQAFIGHNWDFINIAIIFMACMAFTYNILLWFFIVKIFNSTKFAYIFASVTFPLAIGASAMLYIYGYLGLYMHVTHDHSHIITMLEQFFRYIGYIFTVVATCIILYVATRFIINIMKSLVTNMNDDKHHCVYTAAQTAESNTACPSKVVSEEQK
ncbi:hypothetical protein [Ureaplasma ceti]|uniref:TDT family transporter n=1 Tax=Ureaplasma ceti TaxID=3119530 RepID=A0ABP9U939_9BACT